MLLLPRLYAILSITNSSHTWTISVPLKIALFIDADNISYKELPRILKEAESCGQIISKAIFGDWAQAHLQNWRKIAEQHDFLIKHQTNNPNTKNSTDMRLIMDAIEMLYLTPVDCFCLVTNDADFIPLCDRLHEAQKLVIGIGYDHASEKLIQSCDQFIFIGERQPTSQAITESVADLAKEVAIKPTLLNQSQKLELQNLLLKAIAKTSPDVDGWVDISSLRTALREVQTDFEPINYGYTRFKKLIDEMLYFVDIKESIPALARLKNNTTAKRSKLNDGQKFVIQAFASVEKEADDWVRFNALSSVMRKMQEGFPTKNYGHATLIKFLKSMPTLVEIQQSTPTFIRLKKDSNGKAPKPSKALKLNNAPKPKKVQKVKKAPKPSRAQKANYIPKPSNTQNPNSIQKLLVKAFAKTPQRDDSWVFFSDLKQAFIQVQSEYKDSYYGYVNLSDFVQNMPNFIEIQIEGKVVTLARLKK